MNRSSTCSFGEATQDGVTGVMGATCVHMSPGHERGVLYNVLCRFYRLFGFHLSVRDRWRDLLRELPLRPLPHPLSCSYRRTDGPRRSPGSQRRNWGLTRYRESQNSGIRKCMCPRSWFINSRYPTSDYPSSGLPRSFTHNTPRVDSNM